MISHWPRQLENCHPQLACLHETSTVVSGPVHTVFRRRRWRAWGYRRDDPKYSSFTFQIRRRKNAAFLKKTNKKSHTAVVAPAWSVLLTVHLLARKKDGKQTETAREMIISELHSVPKRSCKMMCWGSRTLGLIGRERQVFARGDINELDPCGHCCNPAEI